MTSKLPSIKKIFQNFKLNTLLLFLDFHFLKLKNIKLIVLFKSIFSDFIKTA